MASTTEKGSKNKKAQLRPPVAKTSVTDQAQTIAELRQELEACNRDLAESLQRETATAKGLNEALEQQTATSGILRAIARSRTEIQPVLDGVAENAARLCEASDAVIQRLDGNVLRRAAHYGPIRATAVGEEMTVTRTLLPAGPSSTEKRFTSMT